MAEKIKSYDWQALPVDKWNATTFKAYIKHLHETRLGMPYVVNNHALEGRFINNARKEYGNEAVKRFIERCFDNYRPNPKYPTLSFRFMYSYMRERIMPIVLRELSAAGTPNQGDQGAVDIDTLTTVKRPVVGGGTLKKSYKVTTGGAELSDGANNNDLNEFTDWL